MASARLASFPLMICKRRHFTFTQSSSASRFTAGAAGFLKLEPVPRPPGDVQCNQKHGLNVINKRPLPNCQRSLTRRRG
jgi:hypothetical protein